MLYYIDYKNQKGQGLRISDGSESNFVFYDIDGVSPPDAQINTKHTAGYDGSSLLSASIPERNIVLKFYLKGDISEAKKEIYNVFQSKREGMLHYRSDGWDVQIPCITEKVEIPPTSRPLIATVSLLCISPYWQAIEESISEMKSITNNFYFPLVLKEEGIALGIINPHYTANIFNPGDIPLGMTVEFKAVGSVKNPRIFNTKTFEYLQVNADLRAGDTVEICTMPKKKRVTLIRNGNRINYFNYLDDGSALSMQLSEGDNEFRYTAESGADSLFMRIIYTPLYMGV